MSLASMERRHSYQEMSMLFLTVVFCIFLHAKICTGSFPEVSKHVAHVEGVRRLLEKELDSSTSSLALASIPHGNKTSSSVPSTSSKWNSNRSAKPISSPTNASAAVSAISGQSWCVAMNNLPDQTLQVALDYACGVGGADCGPIQQGGSCFQPDNILSHASYAFNSYYQKNGMTPGTCDFGGTAVTTPTNPSYGTCQYPLSGGLSFLNTTSGTPGTSTGFGPPFVPNMGGAHPIFINLELFLTSVSLLVAVLMFSDQF